MGVVKWLFCSIFRKLHPCRNVLITHWTRENLHKTDMVIKIFIVQNFYTLPLLKSAGDYVIPSVKKLCLSVCLSVRPNVRLSVRLSVCPTVHQRFVFTLYWMVFFTNFLQTWHKSWYWEGVSWDCRWVNFDKYEQSYGPEFTLEIDFRSLSLAFPLYWFSSNFAWELIFGRSVFVLQIQRFILFSCPSQTLDTSCKHDRVM